MGHRRKAREYALQGLYMYEITKKPAAEICDLSWVDAPINDDIRDFAVSLITGTIEHMDQVDLLIQTHTKNWKFERLSIIDKTILRQCIFEMIHLPEIPPAVTINEGIELGKQYGGENSGQFINGILDAVKKTEINEE
jgi:transcription antitermination protein NusB